VFLAAVHESLHGPERVLLRDSVRNWDLSGSRSDVENVQRLTQSRSGVCIATGADWLFAAPHYLSVIGCPPPGCPVATGIKLVETNLTTGLNRYHLFFLAWPVFLASPGSGDAG
jgi:hypothetical protein